MKEFQHTFNDNKSSLNFDLKNINKDRTPIILILDGLSDLGNIGSIFRIADALRIEKIYIYNYDKEFNKKLFQRKSRSTIKYVSYRYTNDIKELLNLKNSYKFIVLDKTNKSVEYNNVDYSGNICLIIGSENTGVSKELINASDFSVHLPMFGINTSINVASATGIALYHIFNNLKK